MAHLVAPKNIQVDTESLMGIELYWTLENQEHLTLKLYRSTVPSVDMEHMVMLEQLLPDQISYADTAIEMGQPYYYMLSVGDASGEVFSRMVGAMFGEQGCSIIEGVEPVLTAPPPVEPVVLPVTMQSLFFDSWAVSAGIFVNELGTSKLAFIKMNWSNLEFNYGDTVFWEVRSVSNPSSILKGETQAGDLEGLQTAGIIGRENYDVKGKILINGQMSDWTPWTRVTTDETVLDDRDASALMAQFNALSLELDETVARVNAEVNAIIGSLTVEFNALYMDVEFANSAILQTENILGQVQSLHGQTGVLRDEVVLDAGEVRSALTTVVTYVNNAEFAASAAAGHTQAAEVAANAAGVHASAAEGSFLLAETAKSQASIFRTDAVNASLSAGESASIASTQTDIAVSSFKETVDTINTAPVLPYGFVNGMRHWTTSRNGDPRTLVDADVPVIQNDPVFGVAADWDVPTIGNNILTKGVVPWGDGRVYRVTTRFRVLSGIAANPEFNIVVARNNAEFANAAYAGTSTISVAKDGLEVTLQRVISDRSGVGIDSTFASTDLPWVRFGLRYNSSDGATQVRVASIKVEDITSEYEALASASASATSAMTASSKSDEAGDHATAANLSRIDAETASGTASVARNQAVSAKDNAEESANLAGERFEAVVTMLGDAETLEAKIAQDYYTKVNADLAIAASAETLTSNIELGIANRFPSDFRDDGKYFQGALGVGDPITAQAVNGYDFIDDTIGRIARAKSGTNLKVLIARGLMPAVRGRTYRVKVRVRASSNVPQAFNGFVIQFRSFAANLTYIGAPMFNTRALVKDGLWYDHEALFTVPNNADYAFIKGGVDVRNHETSPGHIDVVSVAVEDVTDLVSIGAEVENLNTTKVDANGAIAAINGVVSATFNNLSTFAAFTQWAEANESGANAGFNFELNGSNVLTAVKKNSNGTTNGSVTVRLAGTNILLDGDTIVNGSFSVPGNNIQAESINASRMTLGNQSNIAGSADMTDEAYWSKPGGVDFINGNAGWQSTRLMRLQGAASSYVVSVGKRFDVEPGMSLFVSFNARVVSGTGSVYMDIQSSATLDFANPSYHTIGHVFGSGVTTTKNTVTLSAGHRYARLRIIKGNNGITAAYVGKVVCFVAASGELIVNGAITAEKLDVQTLSAVSANVGILRTATSGARLEIRGDRILVYDASNNLRVRMGNLN